MIFIENPWLVKPVGKMGSPEYWIRQSHNLVNHVQTILSSKPFIVRIFKLTFFSEFSGKSVLTFPMREAAGIKPLNYSSAS
jgi:hypothetical protein